ncbi:MAG: ABC transporter ATP-binding protein [Verrucomicrobiae bacterium]|nr:ABC transporter ATP-binding protein [Verrucomicrobiae bacterium]
MSLDSSTISLRNVKKFYANTRGADNINLEIKSGEFFTLLGASGSGKTTLLRLIGGFEKPDDGEIWIGKKNVTRFPAYRRNVHTVFQDYALFPHLTVRDNVAFALDIKRFSVAEQKQKVDEALQLVGLSTFAQRKPSQLSGGQQQRVALARAIVDRPAVLLLDEPLSALDAKIRQELRENLKQLQRETRITFLYVTHDQEEALVLSDRLAVMQNGFLLQVGTPVEIYEQPANAYVAKFIGKTNFITGKLKKIQNFYGTVQTDSLNFQGHLTTAMPLETPAQLMVRPENIQITSQESPNSLSGQIIQSHYLGATTEYLIKTSLGLFRVLEIRQRGAILHAEKANVFISWNSDNARIYLLENS